MSHERNCENSPCNPDILFDSCVARRKIAYDIRTTLFDENRNAAREYLCYVSDRFRLNFLLFFSPFDLFLVLSAESGCYDNEVMRVPFAFEMPFASLSSSFTRLTDRIAQGSIMFSDNASTDI